MAEAPELVRIVNTVRSPFTRMHRVKSASRHRFKMMIGGQRLLRQRSITITKKVFVAELANIVQFMKEGKIALVMSDGMKVTQTLQGEYVLTRADGAIKVLPLGEMPDCMKGRAVEKSTHLAEKILADEEIFPKEGITEIIEEQEAEKAEEPIAAETFEVALAEDVLVEVEPEPEMVPAEEVEAAIEEEGGMDKFLDKVNEAEPAEPHPGIVDYEPEVPTVRGESEDLVVMDEVQYFEDHMTKADVVEEATAEPEEVDPEPEVEEPEEEVIDEAEDALDESAEEEPEEEPEDEEDPEPKKPKRTRCAHPKCRKLAQPGESFCTKHAKEK